MAGVSRSSTRCSSRPSSRSPSRRSTGASAATSRCPTCCTVLFLIAFALGRIERLDGRFARSAAITFAFFLAFLAVYLLGFFNLETATSLAQWAKGMVKFLLHFLFLFAAVALVARRGERFYWWALTVFCGGLAFNALYGVLQLGIAQTTGGNLDASRALPADRRREPDQRLRRDRGRQRLPTERAHRRPEPPRHRARDPVARPAPDLPPARARPPPARAAGADADVPLPDGARDALAQRHARAALRHARPRRALPAPAVLAPRFLLPLAGVGARVLAFVAQRADFFQTVLQSRVDTSGKGTSTHFVVYEFIPQVLSQHPLFGLGLNNFSVYYEFVTGRDNFGPHSFYVALFVETGHRRGAALPLLPRVPVPPARGRALARPVARCGG